MNALKNLKIWVRLVAGIAVMLILALSGIVWWVNVQQQEMGIKQAHDFADSVNQMTIAAMTGMMLTGSIDERAVYLDQIKKTENITDLHLVRGEAVSKEHGQGKGDEVKADDIEKQVLASGKAYYAINGESLRAVIPTLNAKNYLGKDCTTCHQAQIGAVLGVVSMNISLAGINKAIKESTLKVIAAALGLTVLLVLFVYIAVRSSVTTPLEKLAGNLSQIAEGEGDLTKRLEVVGKDEISKTSESFNAFMKKLQSVVDEVKRSAENVLATSRQLAVASQQVTASSEQQSESTASMAAAIEQITVSINHVSDNSSNAQAMAMEAENQSGQGATAVQKAVGEMNKIADSVGRSTQVIRDLGDKSNQISGIVKVIKEIADQTNLLALNAAIEAARAGEQGRGFAVVADEVRKLAERTSTSTQEIANMIEAIQHCTHSAVEGMEQSSSQVQQGVEMAAQASETMARIEASTRQVQDVVREISDALREQSSASTQLAQNVEKIAQMTDENGASAKESSQAANGLETMAMTLKVSVDRFRV